MRRAFRNSSSYSLQSKAIVSQDRSPSSGPTFQLIEVVLVLARDMAIKDVYVYSRPGGLASYISKEG